MESGLESESIFLGRSRSGLKFVDAAALLNTLNILICPSISGAARAVGTVVKLAVEGPPQVDPLAKWRLAHCFRGASLRPRMNSLEPGTGPLRLKLALADPSLVFQKLVMLRYHLYGNSVRMQTA